MNSFGVIELASTKTTNAPGWAYVPDTGGAAAAALHHQHQPTNRKRARTQANLSYADANARQEAKVRKEIDILDRDNHRDVHIAVPPKSRQQQQHQSSKHTPNVRKILQSQKTFANHLDDFVALLSHDQNNGTATAATATAAAAAAAAAANTPTTRKAQQRKSEPASRAASTPKAGSTTAVKQEDVEMGDTPAPPPPTTAQPGSSTILTPYPQPQTDDDGDNNPLLASRVPPVPTDAELRALLSAPPLSYLEARGAWAADDRRYPARVFCGVCGYWGRVKCMKCGARVCALDCLETHQEECVTRYGL
ncbi:hypothetical protein F4779DRAFT_184592 [Xylariaceae sp. FL0662B]|nr:hypothetical protein F4779DRAFT_184592 [Xylariaceae sp. FL0662B]